MPPHTNMYRYGRSVTISVSKSQKKEHIYYGKMCANVYNVEMGRTPTSIQSTFDIPTLENTRAAIWRAL